jgi:hypothetical protein
MIRKMVPVLAVLSLNACAGSFTPNASQTAAWARAREVLDYNADANFGSESLTSGFTPDPWSFRLTAGGGRNPVNVADLGIVDAATGEACGQSFVTRRPDFHFSFATGTSFTLLRFYVVTGNDADATMVINQPDTRWRCNDDHHRSGWGHPTMPVLEFFNPQPGRYDIWVGSFDASAHNEAQLYVTELLANHP